MNDFYLRLSQQDRLRIERIVCDRDDALALLTELLEIVVSSERLGMTSHLDS